MKLLHWIMLRKVLHIVREWRSLLRSNHPIITIEISRSAILENLAAARSLAPQWGMIPVLKSHAYGHGLVLVAEILENERGIPFFAVDSYFEVELMRSAGIAKPVLVLGYSRTATINENRSRSVSFAVASLEQLRELAASEAEAKLQLKFDTGMHRQGIPFESLPETIRILSANPNLFVEGAFSHLAESEAENSSRTKTQIERWNAIALELQKEFPHIQHYHLANSGGFRHSKDIVATVGRLGLALYGFDPGNLRVNLRPVLKMTSVISEIRTLRPGESVGYNATFTAEKEMCVATVPGGYFEGVDRRLSNKGNFLVEGKEASILGRVSMNISSCDLTNIPAAKIGSSVVLISNNAKDKNSVEEIAKTCDTIPYEILVHIPAHLYRKVVE